MQSRTGGNLGYKSPACLPYRRHWGLVIPRRGRKQLICDQDCDTFPVVVFPANLEACLFQNDMLISRLWDVAFVPGWLAYF